MWFDIEGDRGTRVRIAGVHLQSGRHDTDIERRKAQVKALFSSLKDSPKALWAGDCNWFDIPDKEAFKDNEHFHDVAEVLKKENQNTYPQGGLATSSYRGRIDRMFVRGICAKDYEVCGTELLQSDEQLNSHNKRAYISDHAAIFATFQI